MLKTESKGLSFDVETSQPKDFRTAVNTEYDEEETDEFVFILNGLVHQQEARDKVI